MKNLILILALAVVALPGCKKLSELTKFTISHNSETKINAGATVNLPFDIYSPDITTNSESEYKSNNTKTELIESVSLSQLQLTISNPTGKTFDFLKDIELFISAPDLAEKKIASAYGIADNVTNVIDLATENVNIKEFLNKEKYKLRLRITTDKVVSQELTVTILSKFLVDAKILGL